MFNPKSLTVAKELLDRLKLVDPAVTPMQLIKLVYVAHGYMLGRHGRPLLDESVEAWQYGPVVRSVYNAVKKYKSQPIESVDFPFFLKPVPLAPEELAVLDEVTKVYGKAPAVTLSSATHKPDTPWTMTWRAQGKNSTISNDLIEGFYSNLLKQPAHSSL